MPKFGTASEAQLATIHPKLVQLLRLAIVRFDFSVIQGLRGKLAQEQAFALGNSREHWPNSKHNGRAPNYNVSYAADCMPYPVDWSDRERNIERTVFMQGIFWSCSLELDIPIRQGIDWNRNQDMRDEPGLHDYPHIELYGI